MPDPRRVRFVEQVAAGRSLADLTDEQLLDAERWCKEHGRAEGALFRAEWTSRGPTVRSARQDLWRALRQGADCPCCDRTATLRRRSFSVPIALSLVWLVNRSESQRDPRVADLPAPSVPPATPEHARSLGWVCWSEEAPRSILRHYEISRLCLFRVAARGAWEATDGINTGKVWYRPTPAGVSAVRSGHPVCAAIEVYNKEVWAFDEKTTTIGEVLDGEGFDLRAMLDARLHDRERWDALIAKQRGSVSAET